MPHRKNQYLTDFAHGAIGLGIIVGALVVYGYLHTVSASGNTNILSSANTLLLILATLSSLLTLGILRYIRKREAEVADMRSDFVAVASHELRSPLSAVRWNLAELRADPSLSPDARTVANNLYQRICTLIDLTTTFLLMTSVDQTTLKQNEVQTVNFAPFLRDAIAHAQSIALPKKIKIEVHAEFDTPIFVKADAMRLRVVFDNLLSNAIKYSPGGSTVSFAYEDHGSVKRFAVHDMGIGVPKGELKKIFSGYHRAANAQRSGALGSGFGLYMAKKIIDLHRGTITCQSEEGSGTTFIVTLPAGI